MCVLRHALVRDFFIEPLKKPRLAEGLTKYHMLKLRAPKMFPSNIHLISYIEICSISSKTNISTNKLGYNQGLDLCALKKMKCDLKKYADVR